MTVTFAEDATLESLKDMIVEATCMAMIGEHPNIVCIKAVCLDSKPSICMEYCELGE